MGYTARFSGAITITPPLTWTHMRVAPGLEDLRIVIDEEVTRTDTGVNRILTGVAITAAHDFEYGGYAMLTELEAVVRTFGVRHQFVGFIEAVGDEGDRWRLTVRDGHAVRQVARITWEDED